MLHEWNPKREEKMNTLEQTERPGIFALFKGPSGSGKTVGALSFPEVWMADLDKKMPAIARKHFPKKSIDYEQFDLIYPLEDRLTNWLGNCPHETLLFDSITSMVSLILKSTGVAKGEGMTQMLKNMNKFAGKFKQELMTIDYYNAETRIVEHIIDLCKTLYIQPGNPKNIIFTAHILTVESAPDLKTKIVTRTRSIVTAGKKVAAWVPTQFDEVYLFGTSEQGGLGENEESKTHHLMTSETTGEDDAKTAFFLSKYTDFTDKNLYEMLQAQIAGAEMFQ